MTHDENWDDYEDDSKGRALPLRGFAMVLIAVAVLLALWGVYALVSGDGSDSADQAAETSQAETTATAPVHPKEPVPPEQPAPEGEQPTEGDQPANTPEAEQPAEQNQEAAPPATGRVNVLNNSMEQNLAADTATRLRDSGMEVGEEGNLPESQLRVTQNTVYYHPETPGAEQRARELADRVNGVAVAYDDRLPENTRGAGDITLVLAERVDL